MGFEQEPTRNTSESIGTTAVKLADNREGSRTVIYMRNTGTVAVTIQLSGNQAVVLNAGIVLNANEYIVDSNSEGYQCYQGVIMALSSGVGTTVAVYER